jgi:tetratricopeptide (TPR) repeat protein
MLTLFESLSIEQYFLLYIVIAFFVSVLSVFILNSYFPSEKKLIFSFLFLFMMATPFIGVFFALWIIYYLRTVKYEKPIIPYQTIRFDEFFARFPIVKRRFGESAMHEIMDNEQIPISLRLTALTMLSEHTDKINISFIKQMLSSTNDEIRLFSFSVVDKAEHDLNEKIHGTLQRYNDEHRAMDKKGEEAKNLALLYWELVYFELSDEILINFLLDEVEKYSKIALESMPENFNLYMLLGRVYFERGDDETSKSYFEKAAKFGRKSGLINIHFTQSYIAEIEYRQHHYARVREIMRKAKHFDLNPKLKPIQEMWIK